MDAPEVAVAMVTETELVKLPPLGVIVGVATVETATGADTVKVKAVLLVMPPPVALTVIGKFPAGVDPLVLILSIVEQVGAQEAGEKDAVAPEGSPETLKETACAVPRAKVAVIELLTEVRQSRLKQLPEFVSEKSKPVVLENHALASELGLALFLNAFTFKSASVEIVIGPEYFFEDSPGDEPSVV